jgi:hypothetical protein
MKSKSDSHPPALNASAWLFLGFVVMYGLMALIETEFLIVFVPALIITLCFAISVTKGKKVYKKAMYEGVEIEARIVDPQSLWRGPNVYPILYGVPYRPLKVEYELNGETFVSQQDLPDSFVNKLKGKNTLRISVNPEKPMVWVPA